MNGLEVVDEPDWLAAERSESTAALSRAGLSPADTDALVVDSEGWVITPGQFYGISIEDARAILRAENGLGVSEQSNGQSVGPDLFRRYSAGELARSDLRLEWLARAVLCHPTYGQIAGALKTLKSTIGMLLNVSITTGLPLFGRFVIDRPGPVLMYVGEGGRIPFTRRLARIAHALDVRVEDIDLHVTYDVAPIGSPRFQQSLERDLDQIRPVLFNLDPLYAYHGTAVDARQLHQEGALLSGLSSTCMAAGTTLLITNHFNQTGTGRGLDRITQAGSGEWVDSWLLVSHRERPDINSGTFKLLLEIGSRQWGGTAWDLDLTIGVLDPDTGMHDGAMAWNLVPHEEASPDDRESNVRGRLLAIVGEEPWQLTRNRLAAAIGGKREYACVAIEHAVQTGLIRCETVQIAEGTRTVRRETYGLAAQPVPEPGTSGTTQEKLA